MTVTADLGAVGPTHHATQLSRQGATGWIKGCDALPKRPGVYECQWGGEADGIYFNHFDGKQWHYGNKHLPNFTNRPHYTNQPIRHETKLIAWRGLTASVHKRLKAQLS
jgi:hypothetical protein